MLRRPSKLLSEDLRLTLRAQALAGLRDLQRDLEQSSGTPHGPREYLPPIGNRNRLNRCLDLLQRAGEDVPLGLYPRWLVYPGALQATTTGRRVDAVSLPGVLDTVTHARDECDVETDRRPPRPESP